MYAGVELGEAIACLSGALLAEGARPADSWRSSTINVLLGISFGSFGPQGLEMWWARFEKAHRLTTFLCALSGATVCRAFLNWLAGKKFAEMIETIARLREALKSSGEKK